MAEPAGSPRVSTDIWGFDIAATQVGGVAVLAVTGRIGVVTAPRLLAVSARAIGDGSRRILLDLGGVDYISSAGLQVLQEIDAESRRAGGGLVACALSEPVRIALDLAGLLTVLAIEPSRAAGLTRLARS